MDGDEERCEGWVCDLEFTDDLGCARIDDACSNGTVDDPRISLALLAVLCMERAYSLKTAKDTTPRTAAFFGVDHERGDSL